MFRKLILLLFFSLVVIPAYSQEVKEQSKENEPKPDLLKEKYASLQLIASISIGNFYSNLMTLNNYMNEIENKCDNSGFINQVQTMKEAFKLIKGDYSDFLLKVTLGEKDKLFVNNLIKMCDEINGACDALIVVSIKKSEDDKKEFFKKYKKVLELLQNLANNGGK